MSAPATPIEIDADDRLNARRMATGRVLYALVQSMLDDLGDQTAVYYESHIALGLGRALFELAGDSITPLFRDRLNAALPDMVEELFLRAEAVMEAAACGAGAS